MGEEPLLVEAPWAFLARLERVLLRHHLPDLELNGGPFSQAPQFLGVDFHLAEPVVEVELALLLEVDQNEIDVRIGERSQLLEKMGRAWLTLLSFVVFRCGEHS